MHIKIAMLVLRVAHQASEGPLGTNRGCAQSFMPPRKSRFCNVDRQKPSSVLGLLSFSQLSVQLSWSAGLRPRLVRGCSLPILWIASGVGGNATRGWSGKTEISTSFVTF